VAREEAAAPAEAGPEAQFYGRSYWLDHQTEALGLPDIVTRARADLPERCVHWLRALLSHRPPPARVLDVGCGHGGFVALMRWAGYDATGLELSSWVVELARRTFDVPVLVGPLEEQSFAEGSLDVIVLNDVVEHLPDPAATLERCAALLGPDGLLLVQTPCAPEEAGFAELERAGDSFLKMMEEEGHLYLFSRRALEQVLGRVGFAAVRFEPAVFGYDMYAAASRGAVEDHLAAEGEAALQRSPSGRLVLALLDKARESDARRQRTIAQLLGPRLSRRIAALLRRLKVT
jgi:2-polyprenyl-3-methyl-5-hydroxy-6-metoxy-1,4-benzoquinol methylase